MRYENIVKGKFISRPNRFIAMVELEGGSLENGGAVKAHVKNTGRLRELLVPGAEVLLEDHDGRMGSRKLRYSLIGVRKEDRLINIDSQAPNKLVKEAMLSGRLIPSGLKDVAYYKPEYTFGSSRLDFYAEDSCGTKLLGEVKGVTLEEAGIVSFPDAPTERGIKHLEELRACVEAGYKAAVIFVVQMEGMQHFEPNDKTHPQFGEALRQARKAGVEVLAYECKVTPSSLEITKSIPVVL